MTDLASRIDHTILKPEAGPDDVDRIVAEAIEHGFASVCINPVFTPRVAAALAGSPVETCSVAGFPLGAGKPTVTAIEATAAVKDGADEIDFVAHLPLIVAGQEDALRAGFAEIVKAARAVKASVKVKVILETAYLMAGCDAAEGERRIALACNAARGAGCDFVKTSTGMHAAGGATVEAVGLLKKHAGGMYVKAAGGIRTYDDARRMLDAGADRLGCSASVAIITQAGG